MIAWPTSTADGGVQGQEVVERRYNQREAVRAVEAVLHRQPHHFPAKSSTRIRSRSSLSSLVAMMEAATWIAIAASRIWCTLTTLSVAFSAM
jgi:hypothetical protein